MAAMTFSAACFSRAAQFLKTSRASAPAVRLRQQRLVSQQPAKSFHPTTQLSSRANARDLGLCLERLNQRAGHNPLRAG